ncbi:hypothetical protein RRG08_001306 [Elysia crispata]|uniref:Uncharacterized protein n=1 Tax=Elysia crispata TaxID=231223 RepID=A0AAE1DDI2_9GAST|nr:hypothetical protein RRG08_001306 [Elysia crispata]
MEPSTSRDQRNVRPVFQREDIIRMLLNQDDDGSDVDDEPFYENSGSEYEQSEPDSDSYADFEIIGASSVSAPRALFDAENDDVAHREVFAAVVNVSE